MFDKMKQLMEMKRQADQIKRELDAQISHLEEVKGIRLSVNGSQNFKTLEIDEGLLKPENKKSLEQGLLRSINAAVQRSQVVAAQKMKSILPGGFPGM